MTVDNFSIQLRLLALRVSAENIFEKKTFNESEHPRVPQGNSDGGQFTNSLYTYQGTSFDSINNELRYDQPDKFKQLIENLDAGSTDETSNVLYRGLDSNFTKELKIKYKINNLGDVDELKSKLIGKYLVDKSYMSTSTDLNVAADFARNKGTGKTTILQISGRKKGINVLNHISNAKAIREKEFILKRGTRLKIVNVSLSKSGVLILYTNTE